jgi:peroxiredoxin
MRIELNEHHIAPDFNLIDTQGRTVRLSEHLEKNPVVLVFMRGFM